MSDQHPLERRSALLATRAVALRDALRDYIAPRGDRPPFTTHLPAPQALDWWEQHIGDPSPEMRAFLNALPPDKLMELRTRLGQRIAERRGTGVF